MGDNPRSPALSRFNRRQFLQAAGLRTAAGTATILPGLFGRAQASLQHGIPADKKLSAARLRTLLGRGSPTVYRGADLERIGMPVGGIAAGQIYLRGDGTLGCWEIFNRHKFAGPRADCYQHRIPDSPVAQGFAIACDAGGGWKVKALSREAFPRVAFIGQYPIGRVRYDDPNFPVAIEMEAFSPFIPLNVPDSTLPATVFHLTVRNRSAESTRVSALGWLENAVCFHSAMDVDALRRSRVIRAADRALLVHRAAANSPPEAPTRRPPIVVADFEGADYAAWQAEGDAFGGRPAGGALPGQRAVAGFQGAGFVNSFGAKGAAQGRLRSPPFVIERRYINLLIGGGNHPDRVCVNLVVDEAIARSATGEHTELLRWRSWNVREFAGKQARIEIVDQSSDRWGHITVDQIELADERREGAVGPLEQLSDYGSLVLAFAGPAAAIAETQAVLDALEGVLPPPEVAGEASYPASERRSPALAARSVDLAPGSLHRFTFVIAWHFPNFTELYERGRRFEMRGHSYARRFAGAEEVAHYVIENERRLTDDSRAWHEAYYESSLPCWLLERLHAPVSCLATGTCHLWADGRFWAWEGVGCCEGTCTHVWNYAHAPARLFPELERGVRELQDLGEGLQPSGLVGYRGRHRDWRYAADGQVGTVLKCYREHLLSPDDAFLKRTWPRIRKVLEYAIRQDGNADGLIENEQHNTYDINLFGANTFVGSLYIAALRAGEAMAIEMGEPEYADRLRQIHQAGSRLTMERLWNGEYFVQRVDPEKHPLNQYGEGCLSDQLFGQGWAHQLGLGHLYPPESVARALRSVWTYNWAPDTALYNAEHKPLRWFVSPGEAGLFTCTWPKSSYPAEGVRYKNEVWTGIEYQVAGHMVWEGMLREALALVSGIHERYRPPRHNPFNEVECGDHYARALASWGVFTALSGYEYHGPHGHIGFSPRLAPERFRSAFTAAEGWGTFAQRREGNRQVDELDVRWGVLRLKTMALTIPREMESPTVRAALRETAIPVTWRTVSGRLAIAFSGELIIPRGTTLRVTISG